MLLLLGEAGSIRLITSGLVIQELEGALREVAPNALGPLALILDRADVDVVPAADQAHSEEARALINHPSDAQILAAALTAGPDYFATLDRKHFLDNTKLVGQLAFPIGTPGECLEWVRGKLKGLAR